MVLANGGAISLAVTIKQSADVIVCL